MSDAPSFLVHIYNCSLNGQNFLLSLASIVLNLNYIIRYFVETISICSSTMIDLIVYQRVTYPEKVFQVYQRHLSRTPPIASRNKLDNVIKLSPLRIKFALTPFQDGKLALCPACCETKVVNCQKNTETCAALRSTIGCIY